MLKYKLTEKGNPLDPAAPKKIYATHVSKGKKSLQAMARDITDLSSLSRGDVQNVLANMVDQIPKYLLDGNTVSLGELGSLRITFSSEGVDSAADFNTKLIKKLKIQFTAGKLLKEAMEKASFESE